MRKIEENMLQAVKSRTNWKQANTEVVVKGNYAEVLLHGNKIATIVGGDVVIDYDTLEAWPTRTTKSRLRALGAPI